MDHKKQRDEQRAFETRRLFAHDLSFFKFFNLLYILTPITGKYRRFDFGGDEIEYQDIYVFGIRIIRWQL